MEEGNKRGAEGKTPLPIWKGAACRAKHSRLTIRPPAEVGIAEDADGYMWVVSVRSGRPRRESALFQMQRIAPRFLQAIDHDLLENCKRVVYSPIVESRKRSDTTEEFH